MAHTRVSTVVGTALVALATASGALAAGKLVVCMDEWTLSNTGYASAPTVAAFAANVGDLFAGDGTGNFLVYSGNFGLTGTSLASTMTGEGHTWTVSTAGPFTADGLAQYDGVFVAGVVSGAFPNNQVLIDYIEAGGNVYVCGGTGNTGAAGEAAGWNTLLNHFGLEFAPTYTMSSTYAFASAEPLLAGVASMFFSGGNQVLDDNPADSAARVILTHGPTGLGLIGVYIACPGDDDGDGDVDFDDLNRVLSNFSGSGAAGPGDVNGDGDVDFNDLNLVLANFGTAC
jgi:hypothetical protein